MSNRHKAMRGCVSDKLRVLAKRVMVSVTGPPGWEWRQQEIGVFPFFGGVSFAWTFESVRIWE